MRLALATALALTTCAASSATAKAQPWWWWTQYGAVRAAASAFPTVLYWNIGCAGIGQHKFFSVPADWVRPNGTSPAIRTPGAVGQWKFSRFLCIVYRDGQPPLIFTLLPGAGEYDFALLPVSTATNTLSKPFHNGR